MYIKKKELFLIFCFLLCFQLIANKEIFEKSTLLETTRSDIKSVLKGECSSEQESRIVELGAIALIVCCAGMAGVWLMLRQSDKKEVQEQKNQRASSSIMHRPPGASGRKLPTKTTTPSAS